MGKKNAASADFTAVFERLKRILKPFARRMLVVRDDDQWYYLDTKHVGPNKKPIMFAAVHVGKGYVSFHLMPIYVNAKLQATISPALKKRQQGKACFNFAAVDETLLAELESLTKAGAECFTADGLKAILASREA
jgi:hypothetical protein